MTEKRKYPRYECKTKAKFNYRIGDPDQIADTKDLPLKGKGTIHDISQGGLFLITKERVPVGMPINISFKIKAGKLSLRGIIVRTGLLKDNPSEIAQKFSKFSSSGDAYIAVEFKNVIELSGKDI